MYTMKMKATNGLLYGGIQNSWDDRELAIRVLYSMADTCRKMSDFHSMILYQDGQEVMVVS